MTLFFLMLMGHAAGDYALQNDFVARFKSPLAERIGGAVVWPYVLGSHALIHAGFVFIITNSITAAACEFAAHALIDAGKCMGKFGFHVDQISHIACKALWIVIWGLK